VESGANHNATSSDLGDGQAQNGLYEDEVLQLVWTLCPPDCVDVIRNNCSTLCHRIKFAAFFQITNIRFVEVLKLDSPDYGDVGQAGQELVDLMSPD